MASKKLCFVIAPDEDEESSAHTDMKTLLDYVIRPALEKYGFEVVYAHDVPAEDTSSRAEKIIRLIQTAELCVIMLSGNDTDLYYQCGRRHETGKPFIHIVKRGETIPLLLQPVTTVVYDDINSTESAFRTIWSIQKYVDEFERTNYGWTGGTISLSAIAAITDRIDDKLNKLLETPGLLPSGMGSNRDDILIHPVEPPAGFDGESEADADMFEAEDLALESAPDEPMLTAPDFGDMRQEAALTLEQEAPGDFEELDLSDFGSLEDLGTAFDTLGLENPPAARSPEEEAADAIADGDFERAASYLPTIEQQSGYTDYLIILAGKLASQGMTPAMENVQRLLSEHRSDFSSDGIREGISALADYYIRVGRETEGLPKLHALVRNIALNYGSDPEMQAFVLNQLQRVAYSGADYPRAREVAVRVLQLAPNDPDYLLNASRIHEKLGLPARSVEFVDRYMGAGVSDEEHLAHAVTIYTKAGRVPEVRATFTKLAKQFPERARTLLQDANLRQIVVGR
jgi:tetratricopeptide (TPR) repeat protein